MQLNMKSILTVIIVMLTQLLSAQGPVINIKDRIGNPPQGVYYKDIDNLLGPYEGTWLYTNGNTSLKIVMVKKIMQYNNQYYEDLIIGEYEYIKNGELVINTLSDITTNYSNQIKHNIAGNGVLDNNDIPRCDECDPEEKRGHFTFSDPIADYRGRMVARLIEVNGNPAIKINIRMNGKYKVSGEFYDYSSPICPTGEFLLLRQ